MVLLFDISCKDLNVFNYFSFIILFNFKKYKYYIVVEMIVVIVLYKRK